MSRKKKNVPEYGQVINGRIWIGKTVEPGRIYWSDTKTAEEWPEAAVRSTEWQDVKFAFEFLFRTLWHFLRKKSVPFQEGVMDEDRNWFERYLDEYDGGF